MSALLPWAGFEMQILCISMKLPFQTGEKPKNLSHHFASNVAFLKRDTKVKANMPFSRANSFTLLWRLKRKYMKKNVKKLTQTKAGVAFDNCDSPFEIAPWGQCFLFTVFCWFFCANLFVLEGDNSTQLFVKWKYKAAFPPKKPKKQGSPEKGWVQQMDCRNEIPNK